MFLPVVPKGLTPTEKEALLKALAQAGAPQLFHAGVAKLVEGFILSREDLASFHANRRGQNPQPSKT